MEKVFCFGIIPTLVLLCFALTALSIYDDSLVERDRVSKLPLPPLD